MKTLIHSLTGFIKGTGDALWFLGDVVLGNILCFRVRIGEVLKQIYEQGVQSVVIISLTALASGVVLALQGYAAISRFGAKEVVPLMVGLTLVRELGPVFAALVFSGKAGARITAELGTMNVNDQIVATRTMGVDPVEFLVVPRFLATVLVLPILTILAEIIGIAGGYFIGVYEAHVPGQFYLNLTFEAIRWVDFFSGFLKVFFFSFFIAWICCYQGYTTRGGSLGVGRFTTKAVAYSYITIIISNAFLTKFILTLWG